MNKVDNLRTTRGKTDSEGDRAVSQLLEPPALLSNLAESIPKSDRPCDTLWTDNMQRTDSVPIFGWLEDNGSSKGKTLNLLVMQELSSRNWACTSKAPLGL